MTRIFVALYLDEDVDVLIAELLRSYGFDAITVREANQLHLSDREQLEYAISQERALLTHNRLDFESLAQEYYETGQNHYGIILAVRRPSHDILLRLLKLFDRDTADEMKNQVRYI